MNYRPADRSRRLWDTWGTVEGGLYHLFYLGNTAPGVDGSWQPWDGIGHAVSRDLVSWEDRPTAILKSADATAWDAGVIITGNYFRLEGKHAMTFAAIERDTQKTGLLLSDDLDTWRKIPENPVLVAGPPYEAALDQTVSNSVDFRDVSIYPRTGGYEAIFCARVAQGPHHGRGVVGRAIAVDGLHWRLVDPLFHPGVLNCLEVPTRFEADDRHFLLFTTNYHLEGPLRARRYPELRWLTWYAVSGGADGPWSWSRDNLLAPGDSTVGHITRFRGENLFLHHLSSRSPAFALPKLAEIDGDSIRLRPWRGIDILSGSRRLSDARLLTPEVKKSLPTGEYTAGARSILRAEQSTFCVFTRGEYRDCRLRATIDWRGAVRAGILLRERRLDGRAVLLVLDRDNAEAGIGTSWRTGFGQLGMEIRHRYRLMGPEMERLAVDVVLRSDGADWFLDGTLVYTTAHEDTPASGRVGFFVHAGAMEIFGLDLVDLLPEPTWEP